MTTINPNSNNMPICPMPLEQLKKMNAESIFLKFDTDRSRTITDNEIRAQGYLEEAFVKVKEFLIEQFADAVINPKDKDGYFDYHLPMQTFKPSKYEDLPFGSHNDVRSALYADISELNLTREQLLNLCIDKTTILSPEQKAIIDEVTEKSKDPGLGIRQLHEQGITGKGVRMAIIDSPLGRHKEYSSQIVKNVDINAAELGWNRAELHGAGVVSLAVGKTVGVAPNAEVEYYSAVNITRDPKDIAEYKEKLKKEIKKNKDRPEYVKILQKELDNINPKRGVSSNRAHAEAINRILDSNEKAPKNEKVTVISISWGFDELAPGYDDLMNAIERAKQQGVFVVSTALKDHYGFYTRGANRNPDGDLNDPNNYEAGAYYKNRSENGKNKDNLLLVPMDHRTVADFMDDSSYRYEGNDGGMSWSTPWLAGMYVLAKQADPTITPETFWDLAMRTSDPCNNNDTGINVGRIINPAKLIEAIKSEEHFEENNKNPLVKNKEGNMSRKILSYAEILTIKENKAKELLSQYDLAKYFLTIDVNPYGDVTWKVSPRIN